MLRSTPESRREILPWRDHASGRVIVADARVDNRSKLERILAGELRRLRPMLPHEEIPDSAFILAAFLRWGQACVEHIEGDFAFAIWDPAEKTLFCARDRMGAKSLCYVEKPGYFAFATGSEVLLGLPGVSRAPNEQRIASIFVPLLECRGDERSWLADVRALMPGHLLVFSPGGLMTRRRYWRPAVGEPNVYESEAQCIEHFAEIFGRSVQQRTRTIGSLAIMMSGGLDSAGIVSMVRRQQAHQTNRLAQVYSTIADKNCGAQESKAIMSMADAQGLSPCYLRVPSFEGPVQLEDLLDAAWTQAHPVQNMLLLPAMMFRAASSRGHRVMLTGACGDIVTQLHPRYAAEFLRTGQVLRGWKECRAASRNNVYLRHLSILDLLKQNLWCAYAPRRFRERRLRSQRPDFARVLADSLLRREFVEKLQLEERLRDQFEQDEASAIMDSPATTAGSRVDHILSAMSGYGGVAQRYGVESRDPWAAWEVADFFLRVPLKWQVRSGWSKYLVRVWLSRDLPSEVTWRTDKQHFGWRFIEKVMSVSAEQIENAMSTQLDVITDIVDASRARSLHERWKTVGGSAEREAMFELLTLIYWIRRTMSL